jgi:hypothetical protein
MAMLWRALWVVSQAMRRRRTCRDRRQDFARKVGGATTGLCSAFATALSAVIGDLVVAPEANDISAMPKIDRSSY